MNKIKKIDKTNIQDILALTPMQAGLLFHYLDNPQNRQYYEQLSLRLSGTIDEEIIEKTWQHLAENNEMLRTIFRWSKLENPIQIILKNYVLPLEKYDLSEIPEEEKLKLLDEIKDQDLAKEIDLAVEPFRINFIKLAEKNYEMVITNHHILYDGWSNGILLGEFFDTYQSIYEGKKLSKKQCHFKEFIQWCQKLDKKSQSEFWQSYLADFDQRTTLLVDDNLRVDSGQLEISKYHFTKELTEKINNFIKANKTTLATLLYTAWGILLQRYTNSRDIVFGTTVSGRSAKIKGIEEMVGLFINTLPLRITSKGDEKVIEVVKRIEEDLHIRESYEQTPLVEIVKSSDQKTIGDLFNSLVVIENYPLKKELYDQNGYIHVDNFSIIEKTNYDLCLVISNLEKRLDFQFDYLNGLFEKEIIDSIFHHLKNIIREITKNFQVQLSEIEMLSAEEKKQILSEFNDTKVDFPIKKTIHQLFFEQVEKRPDDRAVVFEGKELTYRELNERANQLASRLREKSVGPDQVVGIMVDRSLEMIIGILGILKAGGAYLPIDPKYPRERIEFILTDSTTSTLIVSGQASQNLDFSGELVNLLDKTIGLQNTANLDNQNSAEDMAYVIYTSGSTGKPKGVVVEHKNVVRLVKNNNYVELSAGDRLLQTGALVFDASTFEIWGALLNGLRLYLVNEETILDAEKLAKTLEENEITTLWLTSPLFNQLSQNNPQMFSTVKNLLVGGDILSPKHINEVRRRCSQIKIINGYGPTENTTFSTCFQIDQEYSKNIPIGRPISNSYAYILDQDEHLQPIGVVGELCVGGEGVARGYLNRPELTEERFVSNPFISGERMYHTGDLARWLADGDIEFIGRIDDQVKIRGFRIELGEIENLLLNHEDIKQAVVLAREDSASKYLSAYYMSENELSVSQLREYVSQNLPDYMVPAYFIRLEEMPLTTNGKIDRKVLPEPAAKIDVGREYEPPRNKIEEKLVGIWQEVLEIKKIGVYDNFFELGGHSLKAVTLISKLHKEFNVELAIREVFNSPTIDGLANCIQNEKESIYSSIEPVGEKESYPVSSAQKRLLILHQIEGSDVSYNISGFIRVIGQLKLKRLEGAFQQLVKRHESLRTYFELIEGEPVQKIKKRIDFQVEYIEVDEEKAHKLVREFVKPFDLRKAPLFRVNLLKISENYHLLCFDMHHIISDGRSMEILIQEFSQLYLGEKLPELRIQYKDYSSWQNELLRSNLIKKQEEYWVERYLGDIPVLNMSTDNPRPAYQSFRGASIGFELAEDLTNKLKELTVKTGTTLYMVLLAVYNVLLYKYTGQEDIIVGTPIAGRPHVDLESIIGMFVNTLALRNRPEGEKTFSEFLTEVRETTLEAYENQEYQFEELIEKIAINRDLSRNPLFDTMFVLQNRDFSESEVADLRFLAYEKENEIAKFDLTLTAVEIDARIKFDLEYCTELFNRGTIERLAKHYLKIVKEITLNLETKLSKIEILSGKEKKQILSEFNDTKAEYPKEKTIHQLFEEQVEMTPENIAVVFEGEKLSYEQLNQRANQVARILREKGVGQEKIVGIMVERSLEMILGLLAILKAGGAYLPIDPDYPKKRIKFMLADSRAEILLTQSELLNRLNFLGQVIDLNNDQLYQGTNSNLERINSSKDLAYVIYTSGSTGNPKGVMVEHQAILNTLTWRQNYYKFNTDTAILQIPSFSFDSSVEDIFTTLLSGAKLVLLHKQNRLNLNYLKSIIKNDHISNFLVVPNFYNQFLEELDNHTLNSVKSITVAGDNFTPDLVTKHYQKLGNVSLYNEYGPTENSVCTTAYKFSRDDEKIFIGKPIKNVKCFIINDNEQLQPIGIPGELCITGHGLARGYLNRPELTKEKFVACPFGEGQMYHTGDLARWLPDGNIEFLGRLDNQVKIRGFRIELSEIESQLLSHEDIKQIVVIASEENVNKYLAAYYVSKKELIPSQLREHLAMNLPDYMIPAYFIKLEEMPLTPNGKIDKKALPKPEGKIDSGMDYVAPRNQLEEKLVHIWEEVLGVKKIGINDNFFDLGGHSLKAVTLISKLHKEFNIEISLREVFSSPMVSGLALYIKNAKKSIFSAIEPIEEKEYYPVSSAQKRLLILNQIEGPNISYNMPGIMRIKGQLEKKHLEDAFQELVKRHESLRTYFDFINGEPVQKIKDSIDFKVKYSKADETEVKEIVEKFIKPFDLSKAPLLRVGLIKISETNHILLFDMHHVIADGRSMEILIEEFNQLYQGKKLPDLRIQYKDYSAWQGKLLRSNKLKKQEEYWLEKYSQEIPVLPMPTDNQRPAQQSFKGNGIRFELDRDVTKRLIEITSETKTTLFMILLTAYNVLLHKYTGQEDIIVGTPIAGRPHADLENLIGMFVNTLALRNYPKRKISFKRFLEETRETTLEAYENQDYQFEELIEKLEIKRDLSRNPLFDTMFALQNKDFTENRVSDLNFLVYAVENKIAKFDLTLTAIDLEAGVRFNLEYCTDLFAKETIERLAKHYQKIIGEITGDLEVQLSEIEMLSEEEKKQILSEFNDTKVDFPIKKTIHQLFFEQVEKRPDDRAVVFEGKELTYRELNERANQLASRLREKSVGPNQIVGIMVDRSVEMIIGILGILKAGGAYLPIDAKYPRERIEFILADSTTSTLIVSGQAPQNLDFSGELVNLLDKTIDLQNTANLDNQNSAEDMAYVIYTSGSTGKPKGVVVEHKNVVRLVKNNDYVELSAGDRLLQTGALVFDASTFEIWGALLNGLRLYLVNEETILDAEKLGKTLEENEITTLWLTSPLFNQLSQNNPQMFSTVKNLLVGGDILSPKHINEVRRRCSQIKIINGYGPTENTTFSTCFQIDQEYSKNIPIGRPISNSYAYILDQDEHLQPIGVVGELCVGGEGVARGYLNRPELTEERFVSNPFISGERMYHTGDLARWLADGNIEFIGRIDDQVKIRGFRIELGEIENLLLNHEDIKQAVVLAREDSASKYLSAYYVSENELSVSQLREYVSRNLPDYMVPAYFIRLEEMPLTTNGKIDRKVLPEPDGKRHSVIEYVAATNEVEEKLTGVWSEILGVQKIGIHDNFFELGGHSLKGAQLVSLLHKELNLKINLKDVFQFPTISEMARLLQNLGCSAYQEIPRLPEQEYYELSYTQKRLWIINQLEPDSLAYNMPTRLTLYERVDDKTIQRVIDRLIQRHESLRTRFHSINATPMQIIDHDSKVSLTIYDLTTNPKDEVAFLREEIYHQETSKIFDLENGPLFRAALIKVADKEFDMICSLHHIISDGTSMKLLQNEFSILYDSFKNDQECPLPELKIQYKDYAAWQNQLFDDEDKMKSVTNFWFQQLNGLPNLKLPTDFIYSSQMNHQSAAFRFVITKEVKDDLKRVFKKDQASLFMILLAAYNLLLAKISNQTDIVIGIPAAGRDHADLRQLIGFFVNTIILRNQIDYQKTFSQFLKEVQENTVQALEYQSYPLELFVSKLKMDYPSISVFFNMLNLLNLEGEELKNLQAYHIDRVQDAKFDLVLYLTEYKNGVDISCHYLKGLFNPETIEYMMNEYQAILEKIVKSPDDSLNASLGLKVKKQKLF